MKIEIVRKIDDKTTIMVNELAKIVEIDVKAKAVCEMIERLEHRLKKI